MPARRSASHLCRSTLPWKSRPSSRSPDPMTRPVRSDLASFLRQPVAHRGLHDAHRGIVENSRSAILSAIASGFGVEIDVQMSADHDVVVFHDTHLDRLTEARGPVRARSSAALQALALRDTRDSIPTLKDVLALVDGRAPLLIEMKSSFSEDMSLAEACVAILASYRGPFALMSFDPGLVSRVRARAPHILRGIVAEGRYEAGAWPLLSRALRARLPYLLHWPATRFHFVAYRLGDLGHVAPRIARWSGIPVLTWTVRSAVEAERASGFADQIIFEDFVPETPVG
ncbi:MAG: glycerophosphodiester phosphodiesterase family protein [Pseudomonadota bacterium]